MSKLHYHLRRKKAQATIMNLTRGNLDTAGDATRYEIKGESLRGMERITDHANGLKRQRVAEEAIRVTVIEQREQFSLKFRRDDDTDANAPCESPEMAMLGNIKMAKVYGTKSREALVYARRVVQEDAVVAAEILAEDLQWDPLHLDRTGVVESSTGCISIKLASKISPRHNVIRRVTDESSRPVSPKTLRRHQI